MARMIDERNGNYCRVDAGHLSHPYDLRPPTALTAFVHDSFRALALNERFPCLGGRSAVHLDAYGFGLYNELGGEHSSAAVARDLKRFSGDTTLAGHPFTAFVASFVAPVPATEERFEALLWTTLQQLSDLDDRPWTPTRASDPDHPKFGFSFGGAGYFVVGLHAGSSRVARRFSFPTLVFNPHEQFDRLRGEGKFARFRDTVRTRDMGLQGSLNPMLSDFGEASEARQYSGRTVAADWRCPFHRDAADVNGEG